MSIITILNCERKLPFTNTNLTDPVVTPLRALPGPGDSNFVIGSHRSGSPPLRVQAGSADPTIHGNVSTVFRPASGVGV